MKKIIACAVAAAFTLAGTVAMAETNENAHGNGGSGFRNDVSDTGHKLKNGIEKLGDKARHALHRSDRNSARRDEDRSDTRAMGASGSDESRRHRMDDAYGNWKSREGDSARSDRYDRDTGSSRR